MRKVKGYLSIIVGLGAMLLLMMQGSLAKQGALEGINLCIRVVIPSLFPFLLITAWLNPALTNMNILFIKRLGRLVRIPNGTEGILLLGLIGGYPVGAQCIGEMYSNNHINKQQAKRMLAFCNNAGPAYIFGVTSILFQSPWIPWLLWFIHIISALLVGIVLPPHHDTTDAYFHAVPITIAQALKRSLINMATICGWIVIFKTFLSYFALLPISTTISVILCGFFELSTGTLELAQIEADSLQFILCSAFLSFGGVCVCMQTKSAVSNLGMGMYIHGKIMQAGFSLTISTLVSIILFGEHSSHQIEYGIILTASAFMIIISKVLRTKKLWKLQR